MARTALTVSKVKRTSLTVVPTPPAADVANGNFCLNDGATWLEFTNADGASVHNVTVSVASGVDGLTAGPRTYAVAASAAAVKTGMFPLAFYGNQLLINADSTQIKINAFSALGPGT